MYAVILSCKKETGDIEQVIVNTPTPQDISIFYDDKEVTVKVGSAHYRNVINGCTGYYDCGRLVADQILVKNQKIADLAVDVYTSQQA